ncbi:RNA pyrophosphohydrolase [Candidatus Terasakiella magnetica]|uniref:RNA pyrophosphohydrolase n=1 Tax=Candidatus Terasakiella magnetica TaxID=1867952 RepID=A0A1C3REK0_9PROT|nr:RNA pyrophosphohydrolase [Candidatus Terasakiella magnetica]SCA55685.1 RNA pyrophosphohydrolase [Candidatus Terasakiella magnetica]
MVKKEKKKRPYRPCVGICLFNEKGQVFVAERIDTPGAWQMPQGGIDKGEDPHDAALRELEEEIGTNKADYLARTDDWLAYDLPDHLVGKVWKGKYRGQKQIWFAFRFTGEDREINIDTKHPEFARWQWVELEEIVDLIVPFKRDIYVEIVNQFKGLV